MCSKKLQTMANRLIRKTAHIALLVAGLMVVASPITGLAEEDPQLRPKDQDIHLKLYEKDPPGEPTLAKDEPRPQTRYDKYGIYRSVRDPAIDVYQAKGENRTGAAIIILPGGSYSGLVYGREGINVAKWFREKGITAIVLRYRMKPYRFPVPMTDAQRAIQVVRSNAKQWDIDPQRIGIMGFSAGGHAASLATVYHIAADPESDDPVARVSSRPDFSVLVYPVITMHEPDTHPGSRQNLLGPNPSENLIDEASSNLHVNAQTPPTLLVCATDDKVVPIRNSELFLEALRNNDIPGKLLTYETGGHGFGLSPKKTDPNAAWPKDCMIWLRDIGVIKPVEND